MSKRSSVGENVLLGGFVGPSNRTLSNTNYQVIQEKSGMFYLLLLDAIIFCERLGVGCVRVACDLEDPSS